MGLRRWVAIMMILTCVGLNLIVILGIAVPDKNKQLISDLEATNSQQQSTAAAPTVSLVGEPPKITAGSSAALKWSTTGNPTTCSASGSWSGTKTAFGAESTGRISDSGNYTYTMTCENSYGKAEASATITVGNAVAPKQSHTSSSVATHPMYCGGRLPCYGPHEVAAHSTPGNCWGWNKDRVINISGFDLGYHIVKSGISSIRISAVCGKDLAPSLDGRVSAGGQVRNHNQSTKDNADANEIPYFVGYFDPHK